jgi:hypothetical protein
MKLEDFEIDDSKLTEDQIESLYVYLSMNYDYMKAEEKKAWYYIMQKIDKQFYEDQL